MIEGRRKEERKERNKKGRVQVDRGQTAMEILKKDTRARAQSHAGRVRRRCKSVIGLERERSEGRVNVG